MRINYKAWDNTNKCWRDDIIIDRLGNYYICDEGLLGVDEEIIILLSTNLKDRNGKEIYEGDGIMHHLYEQKLEVYWNNDNSGWSLKGKRNTMSLSNICSPNIEVIGSIYQHPELLKESK